jgi:hypothetical protein
MGLRLEHFMQVIDKRDISALELLLADEQVTPSPYWLLLLMPIP